MSTTLDAGDASRDRSDGTHSSGNDDAVPGDTEKEPVPSSRIARHSTDHWQVMTGVALLAAGVGVLSIRPALVLVAVVCVGPATIRRVTTTPEPKLAVRRSVSDDDPDPGDVVEVETTVRNVGEETLPDCRFVDLAPGELRAVDGSLRTATALRPGDSCTLTYRVEATRGHQRFEGVEVVVGDVAGTTEHEYLLDAPLTITCRPSPEPLETLLLRGLTTPYAGRLSTEKPGEGLEFHSVREYRYGDALRRIDWNQYASTGELATLQFRTERSASVVLVADVRGTAYVRASQEHPNAADRGVEAVRRLLVTLLDEDHRVGITTFGPDYWLAPDAGSEHRDRALDALGSEPALSPSPPDEDHPIRLRTLQLLQRTDGPTQVVICTPLVDDSIEMPIRMLESAGYEVAVVSPDPTAMDAPGDVLSALERRQRIRRIHEYGVPVIDWPLGERLDVALARTVERWSA
ncbi:DUF58 domain-containing protein [Halobacteriales archaeon QH_2_65_14]|nr:MAG: DUF58 domain-containing protein [Halobacteriales archaeon QH_2_65_14]